jgi:hypothetical protein
MSSNTNDDMTTTTSTSREECQRMIAFSVVSTTVVAGAPAASSVCRAAARRSKFVDRTLSLYPHLDTIPLPSNYFNERLLVVVADYLREHENVCVQPIVTPLPTACLQDAGVCDADIAFIERVAPTAQDLHALLAAASYLDLDELGCLAGAELAVRIRRCEGSRDELRTLFGVVKQRGDDDQDRNDDRDDDDRDKENKRPKMNQNHQRKQRQ